MNTKKWVIIPTILAVITISSLAAIPRSTQQILNDFLQDLLLKMKQIGIERPEDKVYLHCDKPFYKPNETIWFAAYIRNGSDLKVSKKSGIVHVELINPKGGVERKLQIIANQGIAKGDFHIDEYAAGGLYKIKAYTQWQKNDANPAFFEKTIQVQNVILPRLKMKLDFVKKAYGVGEEVAADLTLNTNANQPLANHKIKFNVKIDGDNLLTKNVETGKLGEALVKFKLPKDLKTNDGLLNVMIDYQGQTESISKSIPIVLNNIKVQLFPEGGDLVVGLPSKVAFRAVNEFGKPADIEGILINSSGEKLTKFSFYHQGMGEFSLTPKSNETYTVKITKPVGVTQTFKVPEALDRGYGLELREITKDHIFLTIHSTEKEELSVIAQVRGHKYFATKYDAQKGNNRFTIPLNEFPMGVTQITLFDSRGIARVERLAFVNKHKQLNIKIKTDKDKYLPREKVKMTVKVTDERGMPMPANLSLAVADDQLLSFADDKSSNILSWLLMESDIKDKVEEPNFYFDPKEEKADQALDFLLMTSGWRRFTWEQIEDQKLPDWAYQGESKDIEGVLIDASTKKRIKKAKVTLKTKYGKLTTKTDKEGVYKFENVDISERVSLVFRRKGYIGKSIVVDTYNKNIESFLSKKSKEKGMLVGVLVNERINIDDFFFNSEFSEEEEEGNTPFTNTELPIDQVSEKKTVRKEWVKNESLTRQPKPKTKEIIIASADKIVLKDRRVEEMRKEMASLGEVVEKPVRLQQQKQRQVIYHRAKVFATPIYPKNEKVAVRNDFHSTIYWNGHVEVDKRGKVELEFYTSDAITSFNITAEGIGKTGLVGRTEHKFYSQLPFSLSAKMPVEVVTKDIVKIPLTLVNNTDRSINGTLQLDIPKGLKPVSSLPTTITLAAKQAKTQYLAFNVLSKSEGDKLKITFKSKGFNDAVEQNLTIIPKGFPVVQSFSGGKTDKTYAVKIDNLVQGSIEAKVTAYPSVIGELMSGLESMLREPHGCFEQISSSTYPNILVLNYLIQTEQSNPKIAKRAKKLIAKGYKRLTSYESKGGGFEWFGGNPAHEGLTAYGLMEFMDMQAVYDGVDAEMVARTAEWLMSRKDGKGGYQRNSRALHYFGAASNTTMNLYITWALTEANYEGLKQEIDFAYNTAMASKDPYQLGLAANILYNKKDTKRAKSVLEQLMNIQLENGAWESNKKGRSASGSSGNALKIETAALALSALLKQQNPHPASVRKCAEFLRNSRGGYGGFGNTNSTVLALRALVDYAIFSKQTDEAGTIEVYVNDKKVKTQSYDKGQQGEILIDGLEQYLSEGEHIVNVKYIGVKNPLPYTLSVTHNTELPNSSKDCVIALSTKIADKTIKVGETVRLTTTLTNTTTAGQPMTLAIVGLPAGLSAQPWQLKELVDKKKVDFYEVIGNNIVFYYRGMKANQTHTLNLDLKANIAGTYDAPASSAYLYYTNEHKHCTALDRVVIRE